MCDGGNRESGEFFLGESSLTLVAPAESRGIGHGDINFGSGTVFVRSLPDQIFHHVTVHVGQPSLDAVVVDGQSLVVDPQQMQHAGVQVMPAQPVLCRLPANLVGRAVGSSARHAAPAIQIEKPFSLWSRPVPS